jgi:hypothetical protein
MEKYTGVEHIWSKKETPTDKAPTATTRPFRRKPIESNKYERRQQNTSALPLQAWKEELSGDSAYGGEHSAAFKLAMMPTSEKYNSSSKTPFKGLERYIEKKENEDEDNARRRRAMDFLNKTAENRADAMRIIRSVPLEKHLQSLQPRQPRRSLLSAQQKEDLSSPAQDFFPSQPGGTRRRRHRHRHRRRRRQQKCTRRIKTKRMIT